MCVGGVVEGETLGTELAVSLCEAEGCAAEVGPGG